MAFKPMTDLHADYVVWRKGLGPTFTQSNYDVWRAHFGQITSGSSAHTLVPETSATLMCLTGFVALMLSNKVRRAKRAGHSVYES